MRKLERSKDEKPARRERGERHPGENAEADEQSDKELNDDNLERVSGGIGGPRGGGPGPVGPGG